MARLEMYADDAVVGNRPGGARAGEVTSVSSIVAPEAVTNVAVDANADGATADSRTPTVTWTRSADDPEDGSVTYTVTLDLGGTPVSLTDATDLNAATYQIAPALALSDDLYTVTVTPKRSSATGTADSETFYVTPASIGFKFWLDASDAATRFQDSAATTAASANNDPIGHHANRAAATPDATQTTTGSKPRLLTNVLNGKPVIDFETDDWLDTGVEAIGNTGLFCDAGQQFTVFAVARIDTAGTIIARAAATGTARTFQLFRDLGLGYSTYIRGIQTTLDNVPATGTAFLIIITWDGSAAKAYVNNSDGQNLRVETAAENAGERIIVGARSNGTGFWLDGAYAELGVSDTALNDTERVALRTYVNAKWAVY